jgi:hypothetical protein
MKILTIKAKEVKEAIASGLGNKFKRDGFVYKKTINQFEKIQGDFTSIFNILITAWSSCYSIDVRLYISQKQIEKIYENIVGKSQKLTIGNTINRIYASPDGRKVVNGNLVINIYFDEDVEAAVESLKNYYNTIAKPYFEKYQDLKSINNIMNNAPFEHNPADVGGAFDSRCMKGLIVARLVNNPNYEQLVQTYDEAIKGTMDSESIENYYKVREHLMYNRIK